MIRPKLRGRAGALSILSVLIVSAALASCSSPPPPPPAPRAPRIQREYPVNEPWTVEADRVVQGDKVARVTAEGGIESSYGNRIKTWNLSEDISGLPRFSAPGSPMLELLYRMALEEALQGIRSDGAFMAGRKWTGVWTRDISYSIHLGLAHILPENSRLSLMAKVNDFGEIIQDTGTGGSWPISTDRIVWAIAAWELYLAHADDSWLEEAMSILGETLRRDMANAVDPNTGLLFGETSFLDWREQSYPKWMEPKDIFESKAFSTNLLFAKALEIYGRMNALAGDEETAGEYLGRAADHYDIIAAAFPLENGLYSMYLYPPIQGSLPSDKTGTLSNSLAVLFSADDESPAAPLWTGEISARLPAVPFGIPVFEPQQPRIPPYHNAGIWPFVEAYYGLAAAAEGNTEAFEFAYRAMSRSAALFLSHMENMVYDNGHSSGTQINSERQLWSVAGYLSMVYKGLFGIRLEEGGLYLEPTVPDMFPGGEIRLENYRLRGSEIAISISGYGNSVAEMTVNGQQTFPGELISLNGEPLDISIIMESAGETGSVNMIATGIEAPHEPQITEAEDGTYSFRNLTAGVNSQVWNGEAFSPAAEGVVEPRRGEILSVSASAPAPDGRTIRSNLSRWLYDRSSAVIVPASATESYVKLIADEDQVTAFSAELPEPGRYYVIFEYANGNGPINTDNKTAIRSLYVNGSPAATIVLPQRGTESWGDYGLSSGVILDLDSRIAEFELRYLADNRNMNANVNEARVRNLVLIPLQ